MHELVTAIQVSPETITPFHPDDIGARERLRLASTRSAMVAEDVAYSLIGIFKSDIIQPHYGEGDVTRAPAGGDRDSFRRNTNHACLLARASSSKVSSIFHSGWTATSSGSKHHPSIFQDHGRDHLQERT